MSSTLPYFLRRSLAIWQPNPRHRDKNDFNGKMPDFPELACCMLRLRTAKHLKVCNVLHTLHLQMQALAHRQLLTKYAVACYKIGDRTPLTYRIARSNTSPTRSSISYFIKMPLAVSRMPFRAYSSD
jgi:hypothetical protein